MSAKQCPIIGNRRQTPPYQLTLRAPCASVMWPAKRASEVLYKGGVMQICQSENVIVVLMIVRSPLI